MCDQSPPTFPNARQCSAMSKRSGSRCKGPAVKGWSVCRFHGARGGAPRGIRNGRYLDGMQTAEARADRAAGADLIKRAREMLNVIRQ